MDVICLTSEELLAIGEIIFNESLSRRGSVSV